MSDAMDNPVAQELPKKDASDEAFADLEQALKGLQVRALRTTISQSLERLCIELG